MKSQDLKALHQKDLPQLQKDLSQARADQVKLKLDLSAGKLKDVKALARTRHKIAVLQTLIKEKGR